jgi:hypothetical protein
MAMPVGSMVKRFRDEFEQAIEAARKSAPGPLDEEADRVPPPLAVGA